MSVSQELLIAIEAWKVEDEKFAEGNNAAGTAVEGWFNFQNKPHYFAHLDGIINLCNLTCFPSQLVPDWWVGQIVAIPNQNLH